MLFSHPAQVFSQACLNSGDVRGIVLSDFCFLLLLSGLELEFHRFQPCQKLWWALDLKKLNFRNWEDLLPPLPHVWFTECHTATHFLLMIYF